jgi:prepilin-type N-terminal cleavage/methylation domain-containing protein
MKHSRKKGFTIIEVVLVLAIAGMIFLMVFIALPALQRSQRNTQRKNDLSRIMTAVIQYQKNNHNRNPFLPIAENMTDAGIEKFNKFILRYIDPDCSGVDRTARTFYVPTGCGEGFTDPDGTIYGIDARHDTHTSSKKKEPIYFFRRDTTLAGIGGGSTSELTHLIVVFTRAKCASEEGVVEWVDGDNNIAMWYPLEGGAVACVDNQ